MYTRMTQAAELDSEDEVSMEMARHFALVHWLCEGLSKTQIQMVQRLIDDEITLFVSSPWLHFGHLVEWVEAKSPDISEIVGSNMPTKAKPQTTDRSQGQLIGIRYECWVYHSNPTDEFLSRVHIARKIWRAQLGRQSGWSSQIDSEQLRDNAAEGRALERGARQRVIDSLKGVGVWREADPFEWQRAIEFRDAIRGGDDDCFHVVRQRCLPQFFGTPQTRFRVPLSYAVNTWWRAGSSPFTVAYRLPRDTEQGRTLDGGKRTGHDAVYEILEFAPRSEKIREDRKAGLFRADLFKDDLEALDLADTPLPFDENEVRQPSRGLTVEEKNAIIRIGNNERAVSRGVEVSPGVASKIVGYSQTNGLLKATKRDGTITRSGGKYFVDSDPMEGSTPCVPTVNDAEPVVVQRMDATVVEYSMSTRLPEIQILYPGQSAVTQPTPVPDPEIAQLKDSLHGTSVRSFSSKGDSKISPGAQFVTMTEISRLAHFNSGEPMTRENAKGFNGWSTKLVHALAKQHGAPFEIVERPDDGYEYPPRMQEVEAVSLNWFRSPAGQAFWVELFENNPSRRETKNRKGKRSKLNSRSAAEKLDGLTREGFDGVQSIKTKMPPYRKTKYTPAHWAQPLYRLTNGKVVRLPCPGWRQCYRSGGLPSPGQRERYGVGPTLTKAIRRKTLIHIVPMGTKERERAKLLFNQRLQNGEYRLGAVVLGGTERGRPKAPAVEVEECDPAPERMIARDPELKPGWVERYAPDSALHYSRKVESVLHWRDERVFEDYFEEINLPQNFLAPSGEKSFPREGILVEASAFDDFYE